MEVYPNIICLEAILRNHIRLLLTTSLFTSLAMRKHHTICFLLFIPSSILDLHLIEQRQDKKQCIRKRSLLFILLDNFRSGHKRHGLWKKGNFGLNRQIKGGSIIV